jgi:glycosyltransferase involved in cell wall biosynthesis
VNPDQLVSVVVPSYNAAKTLDETLLSVRTQTHAALEIIVVDDGSADDTAAIAERHAAADPRVRVIRQTNGGVAAARNTGWMAARAELIALIDSDDLWAPTKIERQLAALAAGGDRVGLVYCYFVRIDGNGMFSGTGGGALHSGDVLDLILENNFVGNGSSMLVRREVLVKCDGFDNSLRAAGAQGCDDYLFCCRAAEDFHYAAVPEVLVGYREMPGSVSSSVARMLRSWMLVSDQLLARHPGKRALILIGLRNYADWLMGCAVAGRRLKHIASILRLLLRYHPRIAWHVIAVTMPRLAFGRARRLKHRVAERLRGRVEAPPVLIRFPVGQIHVMEEIG